MKEIFNEQENREIIEMLTPKHTPECKVKFEQPRHTRSLWSYTRIIAAAAAIVAIVAGIILSPQSPAIVEQAQTVIGFC